MNYDVVVVGAGPAGSAAARECAALGLSVLCLEEHGTIGYPVQCAGLLSTAAFAECRVGERSVLNRVNGARVITDTGSGLLIDAKTQKAVVVDRGTLDRDMAEAAADAGAEFRLKTALYDVKGYTAFTRGVNGREEIGFSVLIAADGPRSSVARIHRMERAKTFLAGIQADMPGECDPRYVEIYPDASPEFFGWSIPTGPGRIRVGLCARTQVTDRFSAFVKRFGTGSTSQLVTGTLPLGAMRKTYGHRTLFVGDAAGLPKPTSGGGIYTGVRSARHAAAVAAIACAKGMADDGTLAEYERRWKDDFGRELEIGYRLFLMRQKMSPEDTVSLVRALDTPALLRTIGESGDMDRPSALVKQLMLNPSVLRLVRPLLEAGLHTLF